MIPFKSFSGEAGAPETIFDDQSTFLSSGFFPKSYEPVHEILDLSGADSNKNSISKVVAALKTSFKND